MYWYHGKHIEIDGAVFAVDFYGRSYQINIETGKIEGRRFVK